MSVVTFHYSRTFILNFNFHHARKFYMLGEKVSKFIKMQLDDDEHVESFCVKKAA